MKSMIALRQVLSAKWIFIFFLYLVAYKLPSISPEPRIGTFWIFKRVLATTHSKEMLHTVAWAGRDVHMAACDCEHISLNSICIWTCTCDSANVLLTPVIYTKGAHRAYPRHRRIVVCKHIIFCLDSWVRISFWCCLQLCAMRTNALIVHEGAQVESDTQTKMILW